MLGVNSVDEAVELRNLGFSGEILIVGLILEEELNLAFELDTHVHVGCHEVLNAWTKLERRPKLHLEMETGFHRQGFFLDELKDLYSKLDVFQEWIGLCIHLA